MVIAICHASSGVPQWHVFVSKAHLVAFHPPLLCFRWASQWTRSPTTTLTPPTTTPISKWMWSFIMPQSDATALTTPVKKRFWIASSPAFSAGVGLMGGALSRDVPAPATRWVKGRHVYKCLNKTNGDRGQTVCSWANGDYTQRHR